eukprot:gene3032-44229_t
MAPFRKACLDPAYSGAAAAAAAPAGGAAAAAAAAAPAAGRQPRQHQLRARQRLQPP